MRSSSDDATPPPSAATTRTQHLAHAAAPRSALRALPSVDTLVRQVSRDGIAQRTAVDAARAVLAEARAGLHQTGMLPEPAALLEQVRARLRSEEHPHLRSVINATGVLLNTNLGRAPLSEAALVALRTVAEGYSNLEYDLQSGTRGSRQSHVRALITELVGAEDALVVNNNASAVLLALSALASGHEVILSRGELVEIGGGFRVPDVLRQSGARLVEVGTTNRTRVADYSAAVGAETALLLSVHPSNFRVVGFTESPPLAELSALAHRHDVPLVHDLGSGCLLRTERWGLAHEPTPQESLSAGVDLVCFSGDKLLGGPQAGLIAGRRTLVERLSRHPLARALRIDKLTLAALEATLAHYRAGEAERAIPLWRAIATPLADVHARADAWAGCAAAAGWVADVTSDTSWIGGGSLPGEGLPTMVCRLRIPPSHSAQHEIGAVAEQLRAGHPPVIARVVRGHVLLDPRTVLPDQDDALLAALRSLTL